MRNFFIVLCLIINVSVGVAPKAQLTTLPIFSYGNAEASIEVIEFCSMYCPACDYFKQTTFPDIEKHFIASNQIQWVRIPFAIDFGDVLMLAYMKHLPKEQLLEADAWYKAFRERSNFTNEDEFHERLIFGLKERFSIFKDVQRAQPEEIDGIVQETIRLVEHHKLKNYPTVLIDGQCVSTSRVKEALVHKLKQRQK